MADDEHERIACEIAAGERARYLLAVEMGPMALLRLRAEILLERADAGEDPLTDGDRAKLHRIALTPTEEDRIFLDGFGRFLGG